MQNARLNGSITNVDLGLAQRATVYKNLCDQTDKVQDGNMVDGWSVVDTRRDPKSGFIAAAYKKGNTVVVCYGGTNFKSIKDHGANLKMALDGPSRQMKQANEYFRELKDKPELKNSYFETAGHSEGGSEATYVGLMNNARAYTYNPYGLTDGTLKKMRKGGCNIDTSLITNFRDSHDPISKLKENVGDTYIVPSTQNKFMRVSPFGLPESHRLEAMGNIEDAIPIDEYKKIDRFFIDNIKDVHITKEDMEAMPNNVFSLYEEEIDNRLRNHQFTDDATAHQMALHGELIYVRPYQRDDGTPVRGYYRRLA